MLTRTLLDAAEADPLQAGLDAVFAAVVAYGENPCRVKAELVGGVALAEMP